ncbi:flagellar biosynthetic protein FliO [Microbacterium arborescens]|uniref:flagellar biosynthetic protein FliO n=1 Tax=Microbacterium arborescens TaxID=33883 RepID=UPI0025A2FD77|nr:flagellar biosynthetic protein FliO [Microbacterium arborescens]WJM15612.1 flagellar biosynthetic protein FliO [Microbacterium arborescens]
MRCASRGSSRTRRPDIDDLLLALRVVVSLGVVLGIVWVLQRRFSRSGGIGGLGGAAGARARGARSRRSARSDAVTDITVVAKRGIGPKAQVAVVEIDGARYVLGITEGGVSMLDRIDPASDAPSRDAEHDELGTSRPALRDVAGGAPLSPPVPLLRSQARAERTARPAIMTARDAAQVLRRALGA